MEFRKSEHSGGHLPRSEADIDDMGWTADLEKDFMQFKTTVGGRTRRWVRAGSWQVSRLPPTQSKVNGNNSFGLVT